MRAPRARFGALDQQASLEQAIRGARRAKSEARVMNESFRHLTAARRRIAARREAVRILMDEGHSARAISEIIGVSHDTAARDVRYLTPKRIEESGEQRLARRETSRIDVWWGSGSTPGRALGELAAQRPFSCSLVSLPRPARPRHHDCPGQLGGGGRVAASASLASAAVVPSAVMTSRSARS